MKSRGLILLLFLFLITNTVIAQEVSQSIAQSNTVQQITQPQNILFENCYKMFTVNKEKLFYLTLDAISANKFNIEEIQTDNGYIIFSVAKNKYLATIAGIDSANSILKITPCNDVYFFPPGIIINMFKYVELNLNTEIK